MCAFGSSAYGLRGCPLTVFFTQRRPLKTGQSAAVLDIVDLEEQNRHAHLKVVRSLSTYVSSKLLAGGQELFIHLPVAEKPVLLCL